MAFLATPKRIDYTTKHEKARARTFLAHPGAKGDHGFKGEALERWNYQRLIRVEGLQAVIAGKIIVASRVRNLVKDGWGECPQILQWSAGTREGEDWVSDVRYFLRSVSDSQEYRLGYGKHQVLVDAEPFRG